MSERAPRTVTTREEVEAIQPSTDGVEHRHLILGGRSGSGLETARALARRGHGVMIGHSGFRKQREVDMALATVRADFNNGPGAKKGDAERDVIAFGGDVALPETWELSANAATRWLGHEGLMASVILNPAAGTDQSGFGKEVLTDPDEIAIKQKISRENADAVNHTGLVGQATRLVETMNGSGISILTKAAMIYPTSDLAHKWKILGFDQLDPESEDLDPLIKEYFNVAPGKQLGETAQMTQVEPRMVEVGGKEWIVTMGAIDGTLVVRGLLREMQGFRERPDVAPTMISDARAGEGMAELILTNIRHPDRYPSGSVLAIRPGIELLTDEQTA